MFKLSNIVKSYPDGTNRRNFVLQGLNLTIEGGEFVAITGASGSGKTTLLSIFGILSEPDSGVYELDRQSVFTSSQAERAWLRNRQIGFLFQEHRLMPQLTLLQNILLPTLALQSKPSRWDMEYAYWLMETTGITTLAEQYPASVSGGQAGRAALCRALIMKPPLLLADEPTGQLDAENARNIIALLQTINDELDTTILMVSHSPQTVAAAPRILTLNNGILS